MAVVGTLTLQWTSEGSGAAAFTVSQAASVLDVLWLDTSAAISVADARHTLGLYRGQEDAATQAVPPLSFTQTLSAPSLSYKLNIPTLVFSETTLSPSLRTSVQAPVLAQTQTLPAPSVQQRLQIPLLSQSQSLPVPSVSYVQAAPTLALSQTMDIPLLFRCVGTGTYSRVAGDQTLTPGYLSGIEAGDLLILQTGHVAGSVQYAATYGFPGDWTQKYLDSNGNNTCRQWIHTKVADGTETGTVSITVTNGEPTTFHQSVIHVWRGANANTLEGPAVSGANSTTVADADITTTGSNRIPIQFGLISSNQAPSDFTGETGGDWRISTQSGSGNARLYVQVSSAPTATTVGGGTFTIGGSSQWIVRGFALLPTTPASLQNLPLLVLTQSLTAPSLSAGAQVPALSFSQTVPAESLAYQGQVPSLNITQSAPDCSAEYRLKPSFLHVSQAASAPSLAYQTNLPALSFTQSLYSPVVSGPGQNQIPVLLVPQALPVPKLALNIRVRLLEITQVLPTTKFKILPLEIPNLELMQTWYPPVVPVHRNWPRAVFNNVMPAQRRAPHLVKR